MAGFRPGKVPMKMVEAQYGMQVDFEVQFDHASKLFFANSKKQGLKIDTDDRLAAFPGESFALLENFSKRK
jgi:trigger factor